MDALDPRHGTRAGAMAHWRAEQPICEPCRRASRRASKERRLDVLRGRPRTIPLGDRAHDILLNIPNDQLRRATGIGSDKIARLKTLGATHRVHRSTRDRILEAGKLDFWTAIGIQRRLRALSALGWSMRSLAGISGANYDGLKRLRARENPVFVRRHLAEAVLAMYDDMSMAPAPEGRGASRARGDAQRRGWAPPLAWDDIDDPNELPHAERRPNRPGRPETLDAVLEDFDWLVSAGESPEKAARRVGVALVTIRDYRSRQARRVVA